MNQVVLICGYVQPRRIEALRRDRRETEIYFAQTLDELLPQIERAEVLASAGLPAEVAARANRLRWWHTWAAGPDQHLAALAGRPMVVTCSKGNGAIPLAEHALMLMLMVNRRSSRWAKAQAERRCGTWPAVTWLTWSTCQPVTRKRRTPNPLRRPALWGLRPAEGSRRRVRWLRAGPSGRAAAAESRELPRLPGADAHVCRRCGKGALL